MTKEIHFPAIGENVEEGTVTEVLVAEGDAIEADQNILEMETDKASVQVPAPFGGTVTEILVSSGDTVSVGQAVLKVETEEGGGEEPAEDGGEKQTSGEKQSAGEEKDGDEPAEGGREKRGGIEQRDRGEQGGADRGGEAGHREQRDSRGGEGARESRGGGEPDAAEAADRVRAADVPASPATRRLAREIGVDITQVSGSGPGGRISQDDVKAHAREGGGRSGGAAGAPRGGPEGAARGTGRGSEGRRSEMPGAGEGRREKMTRVRSLTAERTTASWQNVPHVTQHEEADLTELNAYMKKAAPKVEKAGGKLTLTAVITKLVAQALRIYPRFNASADMEAGEIVYHPNVAIGIAADTDRGLLVPVVRDPDRKSIVQIALEIGELAKAARNGDLEPSQMQGQTFSISNLGGIGGTAFTPVIVPPCVAILGIARAQTKPVYTGATFEPRQVLPMSLSYDHRVIDGADGARLAVWLKTAIEDPFAALMEGGA